MTWTRSLTRSTKAWKKQRAGIEPIFGHLKSDSRMSRIFLKGREGDQINAILCGCGFNTRKLPTARGNIIRVFMSSGVIQTKAIWSHCENSHL